MIDRAAARFDVTPLRLAADAGYGSAEMLGWLVDERGIEPHVKVFDKSERNGVTSNRAAARSIIVLAATPSAWRRLDVHDHGMPKVDEITIRIGVDRGAVAAAVYRAAGSIGENRFRLDDGYCHCGVQTEVLRPTERLKLSQFCDSLMLG
jgi:hypothetical protein